MIGIEIAGDGPGTLAIGDGGGLVPVVLTSLLTIRHILVVD